MNTISHDVATEAEIVSRIIKNLAKAQKASPDNGYYLREETDAWRGVLTRLRELHGAAL